MRSRAVFFDKDGTLVQNVPYNVDPERMRLAPGALSCARRLREAGFRLFVVSNQAGVALGYHGEADLHRVRLHLERQFEAAGAALDGFYYCPHLRTGNVPGYARACGCRKPAAGLLRRAAREHGIDLSMSWMVGDILNDVEAGRRAGCRTVFLDVGNETEWDRSPLRWPDATVTTLREAADAILLRSRVAAEARA